MTWNERGIDLAPCTKSCSSCIQAEQDSENRNYISWCLLASRCFKEKSQTNRFASFKIRKLKEMEQQFILMGQKR